MLNCLPVNSKSNNNARSNPKEKAKEKAKSQRKQSGFVLKQLTKKCTQVGP